MDNYTFTNSFGLKEFKFSSYQANDLRHGIRYNFIAYLVSGYAKFSFENLEIKLNPGEIIFIPRGQKYFSHWRGDPTLSYKVFYFSNYPSTIKQQPQPQKIVSTDKILDYINSFSSKKIMDCHMLGIFFLMLDEIFNTMTYYDLSNNHTILNNAMNYLTLNPSSTISNAAKHCGVSESKLYSLFKNTDTTPAKYKLNSKLEQALNYLLTTDIPIETISDTCGFSSSSYFRKKFFQRYNTTPSKARKTPLY